MSGLYVRIEASSRVRLRFLSDERLVQLVREGNGAAFEAIYDRHAASLLSFCVYMLGSHHDAEDAVQATFSSAHKALLRDDRDLALRPWLFVVARNACVSVIRKRRTWVELNGEPALDGDPARRLEVKNEVRQLLDGLLDLPEPQRAALVMAEVQGLSQREISSVMGIRPAQVKAFTYQARSNLIAERHAREADCSEIRDQLAQAHGAGRLKGPLRRHLRTCDGCRAYQRGLRHQSRALGALFPVVPSLALKTRALQEALGNAAAPVAGYRGGAAVSGGAAGTFALASGGLKAVLAVVAGVACVGACGVGASLLEASETPGGKTSATTVANSPSEAALGASLYEARTGAPAAISGGLTISGPGAGPDRSTASEAELSAPDPGQASLPSVEIGAVQEDAGSSSESSGPSGSGKSPPAPGAHERDTPAAQERLQAAARREQAIEERKSGRLSGRTSKGEEHARIHEEAIRTREQRRQAREQQATEREERARSLHALPPELRKAAREELKAEREERKAEKEQEPTG